MPRSHTEQQNYGKTQLLKGVRRAAKVSQEKAAEYFGLGATAGRDTVRDWENGIYPPEPGRRTVFISYLVDILGLQTDLKRLEHVWSEVMIGEWGWLPLEDYERPKEPPRQIQAPQGFFVGHAEEITEIVSHIRDAISSDQAAICSIYGMGGVGKTKLARKIAWEIRNLFPGGHIFLVLRGEGTAQLAHEQELSVSQALINVIRELTYDNKLPSALDELTTYYQNILEDRRVIILADNARDARQVENLVPPPGSALIVTSRFAVRLEGMKVCRLGVLQPTEAIKLLLKINADIGKYAAELAELCGYLPLALQISASLIADTPSLELPDFLKQLRQARLSLLVAAEQSPDDPKYSVEASLNLSYQLLDRNMQQAMQQLSVFPASFNVAAAQAIVRGVEKIDDILPRLYRRSMVEWDKKEKRYVIHDLVREYCLQQIQNTYDVELRHARYYADLVTAAEAQYMDGENLEALAIFDRERTHIDKGWNWAEAHAGEPDADALLISYGDGTRRLGGLRYSRRTTRKRQMQAMLDAAERLGDRSAQGRALHYIGNNHYLLSDMDNVLEYLEPALEIATEEDAQEEMADLESEIGLVYMKQGHMDQAIMAFTKCLDRSKSIQYQRGQAVALCNLGYVRTNMGEVDQAISDLTDSLTFARAIKSKFQESSALTYLGNAYSKLGQTAQAIEYFEQSLLIDRQLRDREGEATSSMMLGELLVDSDPQRADALLSMTYNYAKEIRHNIALTIKSQLDALRKKKS